MVHVSGELAVPLYLEALNGYWRVARVIRDAGSYAINGAQMLRVTLSGNNPSRVVVVAEF